MSHWGFDHSFDASASITRRKRASRLALALVMAAIMGLIADLFVVALWVGYALLVEGLLAFSIRPTLMKARPAAARVLRLVSTSLASLSWVAAAGVFLAEDSSSSAAVAVALLAGICLYVIGACYRTPIHIAAAGIPPSVAILLLPFLLRNSMVELIAMELAMLLVVGFGASSAMAANRAHQRLGLTTTALRRAKQRAVAADASKSEFLANMSHELRTPLTSVIGFSSLLTRSSLPPIEQSYVDRIGAASEALLSVINDILDYSKLEATTVELDLQPFSPRDLVARTAGIVEANCVERGVTLSVDFTDDVPETLIGDVGRLRQVLLNLLSNAAKFTRKGRVRVQVTGQPVDDKCCRLHVAVTDTGHGIASDKLERLFERFTQADASTSRRFGGTGLGLAISKRLIEAMGGTIGADSELDVGSTFWFEVELDRAVGLLEPAAADRQPSFEDVRILVADDVMANQELLNALLSAAGCSVDCVSNGQESVTAVAGGTFDLVFMDVHMPQMDGLAATRAIRASGLPTAGVRIVALTANVQSNQIAQCLAAGMDGHVAKPIRIPELMAAVASVAGALPPRQPQLAVVSL